MIDIQRYRKEKKMTQKVFSELAGISQSILSRYESGKYVAESTTELLLSNIPELLDYLIEIKDTNNDGKLSVLSFLITQQKDLMTQMSSLVAIHKSLANTNETLSQTNLTQMQFIDRITTKSYEIEEVNMSIAAEPDVKYAKKKEMA